MLVFVAKGEPVCLIGVACDGELVVVVGVVVFGAEATQIGCVGGAAVEPVDDVMNLESVGAVACGMPTDAVAVLDDDTGAEWNDVTEAAHVDR